MQGVRAARCTVGIVHSHRSLFEDFGHLRVKNIRGSVPGKAADVIWEAAHYEVLGQVEGSKAAQATEDTIRDRGQAVAGHVQGQQCGSCREAARQLVQCIVAGVHLACSNKC